MFFGKGNTSNFDFDLNEELNPVRLKIVKIILKINNKINEEEDNIDYYKEQLKKTHLLKNQKKYKDKIVNSQNMIKEPKKILMPTLNMSQ